MVNMPVILTTQQMRDLERSAMEAGNVSGLELMERAGSGVVDKLLERWPELDSDARHALVLCGPGNNGGDGYVVARLLLARGWLVHIRSVGDPEKLPPDALTNYRKWRELAAADGSAQAPASPPKLIVDALFGTGLARPIDRPEIRGWLKEVDAATLHADPANFTRTVAIDCPSGLDADTGRALCGSASDGVYAPHCLLTVTFHSAKPGHFLGNGPAFCGELSVVDIGIHGSSPLSVDAKVQPLRLVSRNEQQTNWPLSLISKHDRSGHKYEHGHALVFTGDVGRGGAGRLAARSALRVGAGLVTVVCPPDALAENAARLDAVMLGTLSDTQRLTAFADARVSSLCLGPGMGVGAATSERVIEALSHRSGSAQSLPVVVLDADALTSFEDAPDRLFDAVHERTVLTPHEGEFARLFPDLSRDAKGDRSKVDVVRDAATRAGCVVLLKGVTTVIASPSGATSLHAACYDRAAPWLATAGAGDVLAGIIAGIGASQPATALAEIVEVAVWLHVEAALSFGPGLIAEDLPEQLPIVLSRLVEQGKSESKMALRVDRP